MGRLLSLIIAALLCAAAPAQERKEQNKPYIDLRTLHFGILVGAHLQDIELQNMGPQADGTEIVCDADTWNPGFSVGVLAELRLTQNLALRLAPAMHFGSKHLVFRNLSMPDANGRPHEETQDMKNTYISLPLDIKFAAPRFNNHRPYIMAGINPMINLTGKDKDYVVLKRYDTMLEVGMGCDFYLRFFKLIPELKFCYSLRSSLDTGHIGNLEDETMRKYASCVGAGHSKMIVLTLYFE